MLSQEQMVQKFAPLIKKEGKTYRKSVVVKARLASLGEVIQTITDGKVETSNAAKEGDFVVINPTGECYIIPGDKFKKRYEHFEGDEYKATGRIIGLIASKEIADECPEFEAAWGEPMILEEGDVLAMPLGGDPEVYRIAKSVFKETYEQ